MVDQLSKEAARCKQVPEVRQATTNISQVFGPSRTSFIDSISQSFYEGPTAFLFGGFPAWVAAEIPRLVRRTEISEPVECMNYLDFDLSQTAPPWQDRLWDWLTFGLWLTLELPFEFTSTLQSLGFAVLPALWPLLRGFLSVSRWTAPSWLVFNPLARQLAATTGLYLLRDHLHRQMRWRIYGLLRQTFPRPQRPTKLSIRAKDEDDIDDASIIGIGRSLGAGTGRRFYGPQSLWAALPVAFPWLSHIMKPDVDKEGIKKETLTRCMMMERSEDAHDLTLSYLRDRRAERIVSNLESLGVDTEEDFYVDIEQWTRQIDSVEMEDEEEVEVEVVMPLYPGQRYYTDREDSPLATEEYRRPSTPEQQQAGIEPTGHAGATANGDTVDRQISAEQEETDGEAGARSEGDRPSTHFEEAPATPEPGIRRATSLSTTTPRPIRRPTETNGPDFDDEMEAMLAEARRRETRRKKVKSKDNRECRMTRLTTHAIDSLAWHSSAIITSLVMLPIDAMYYRSLASWFISTTGLAGSSSVLAVSDWAGGISSRIPGRWPYHRMLLLNAGLECLVRGAIWQIGCRVALSYGRSFGWGDF